MEGQKILVVEDNEKITEVLNDFLVNAGFDVSILNDGDGVINEVRHNPPDLIILDIMLPGKDGWTIFQEIRSFSQIPVLILTAKIDEIDRVLGLELGADDYVCKPFSPREVVLRIKAILRRTDPDPEYTEEKLVAGPITINPESYNATIAGKKLCLTPVEFKMLQLMASNPSIPFTRNDFVFRLQGDNFGGSERIIDSHIKNLRKKMDEAMPGNRLIQTIYGIGYALSAPQSDN